MKRSHAPAYTPTWGAAVTRWRIDVTFTSPLPLGTFAPGLPLGTFPLFAWPNWIFGWPPAVPGAVSGASSGERRTATLSAVGRWGALVRLRLGGGVFQAFSTALRVGYAARHPPFVFLLDFLLY